MKKLKEPKTFNKPRAYIRVDGKYKTFRRGAFRIRIIYPDGVSEWSDGTNLSFGKDGFEAYYPCWHKNYQPNNSRIAYNKSLMTAEAAVKAMKKYDKQNGFKTLFIGEF